MKQKVINFLDLLWEMTIKELRLRYKNTALGFLWVIIYPIMQAIIIGYIFHFLYKIGDKNYQYSLFLNLLIWNFFSSSLENATPSIVRNRSIIKKAKFPYMVIPLSNVLCNGIHMLLPLVLFSLFLYIFHIVSSFNPLMILISCLLLLFFTGGLSLITSGLNVKNRDVNFLVHAFLMIWFYATPIVYTVSAIPLGLKYLWSLNPLTEIIMFSQNSYFKTPLSTEFIFLNTTFIVLSVIIGLFIFLKRQEYFDDYV